jgi:hypothetical protein
MKRRATLLAVCFMLVYSSSLKIEDVSPKYRLTFNKLQDVISQKTGL